MTTPPRWEQRGPWIPTTDVELRLLADRFGVPAPRLYPYGELAEVCGIHWPSDRGRLLTILSRWRGKLERDFGLVTEGIAGEGIKVLREGERGPHVIRGAKIGNRKLVRHMVRGVKTDLEKIDDSAERRVAEHVKLVAARLLPTITKDVKALEPPPPPKGLPRKNAG